MGMVLGQYFDTVIGRLYLAVEDGCVVRLSGGEAAAAESKSVAVDENVVQEAESLSILSRAIAEITEYLAGERACFDIPLRPKGTSFQKKVWDALREIPYGETRTYGQIAQAAGSPRGARAVGMACNRNPIMLLIPCHRVVGSTGKPVGFAGGLPMKEFLLGLERKEIHRKGSSI